MNTNNPAFHNIYCVGNSIQVRVTRMKEGKVATDVNRMFNPKKLGGKRKALDEAILFRNETMLTEPKTPVMEHGEPVVKVQMSHPVRKQPAPKKIMKREHSFTETVSTGVNRLVRMGMRPPEAMSHIRSLLPNIYGPQG